jgi:hypothetical protein
MAIERFEQLEVWQAAHGLVLGIERADKVGKMLYSLVRSLESSPRAAP